MTPGGVESLVYAVLFFAVIGLAMFAFTRWAIKDTSHMPPEKAVDHRERVIKVEKAMAVSNVALTVLDQAVGHAGPGPAKPATASDVVVPAIGLASYAWTRHAERQKDIADGVNPDLPPEQLHAARVAAEYARRGQPYPGSQPYPPQHQQPENLWHDDFLDALRNYNIGYTDVDATVGLAVRVGQLACQGFGGRALTDMVNATRPDLTREQAALFTSFALGVYAPQEYARIAAELGAS